MKTKKQLEKLRDDSEKVASIVDEITHMQRVRDSISDSQNEANEVTVWVSMVNGERKKMTLPASVILGHLDTILDAKSVELQ
jgi:glutaredoxin 2